MARIASDAAARGAPVRQAARVRERETMPQSMQQTRTVPPQGALNHLGVRFFFIFFIYLKSGGGRAGGAGRTGGAGRQEDGGRAAHPGVLAYSCITGFSTGIAAVSHGSLYSCTSR